jgi:hypothetical protein
MHASEEGTQDRVAAAFHTVRRGRDQPPPRPRNQAEGTNLRRVPRSRQAGRNPVSEVRTRHLVRPGHSCSTSLARSPEAVRREPEQSIPPPRRESTQLGEPAV